MIRGDNLFRAFVAVAMHSMRDPVQVDDHCRRECWDLCVLGETFPDRLCLNFGYRGYSRSPAPVDADDAFVE